MVSCFVAFGTHPFILVCPNLYLSMDDKMNLEKRTSLKLHTSSQDVNHIGFSVLSSFYKQCLVKDRIIFFYDFSSCQAFNF